MQALEQVRQLQGQAFSSLVTTESQVICKVQNSFIPHDHQCPKHEIVHFGAFVLPLAFTSMWLKLNIDHNCCLLILEPHKIINYEVEHQIKDNSIYWLLSATTDTVIISPAVQRQYGQTLVEETWKEIHKTTVRHELQKDDGNSQKHINNIFKKNSSSDDDFMYTTNSR